MGIRRGCQGFQNEINSFNAICNTRHADMIMYRIVDGTIPRNPTTGNPKRVIPHASHHPSLIKPFWYLLALYHRTPESADWRDTERGKQNTAASTASTLKHEGSRNNGEETDRAGC